MDCARTLIARGRRVKPVSEVLGVSRAQLSLYRYRQVDWQDVLPVLMRAGHHGFVAKNADAFQIVRYDRDAVPEYLGVWEWSDL